MIKMDGKAEVGEQEFKRGLAAARFHKDVPHVNIAMDNATFVDVAKCRRNVCRNLLAVGISKA
jgi:hypothetical protein